MTARGRRLQEEASMQASKAYLMVRAQVADAADRE
jgi:hypothetical protein